MRVELAVVALERAWLELLIQAVAAGAITLLLAALAAPVLSSCPTPCQKAQQLNFCLLRHGQHQQASLPLIIWW